MKLERGEKWKTLVHAIGVWVGLHLKFFTGWVIDQAVWNFLLIKDIIAINIS